MRYVIKAITVLFLASLVPFSNPLWAHSGGLNSQGCHAGSQPYHCHRSAREMTRSSSGGNRLRCDLGSQSRDCKSQVRDSNVEKYQRQLMRHCSNLPIGFADGSYGPKTRSALIRFQQAYGLKVDGKYGPSTARALAGRRTGSC